MSLDNMSLENSNVTFHIGMPKTASTTIQKYFAENLVSAEYYGPERKSALTDLFLKIYKLAPAYYDSEQLLNEIKSSLDPSVPLFVSSEFFSSYLAPLSSGLPQSKVVIRDRIYELAPHAKIVIIIRNQFDFHKSLYAQLIRNEVLAISSRKLSFKKWLNHNIRLNKRDWVNVLQLADYATLIKLYQEKFEHVAVFVYEEIIKDFDHFINEDLRNLAELENENFKAPFSSARDNKRHNKLKIYLEYRIDTFIRWYKKRLGDPFASISKDKKASFKASILKGINRIPMGRINPSYSKEHYDFINEYYKNINAEVVELTGKDLGKYKYPL
jgi:hypothetical protein